MKLKKLALFGVVCTSFIGLASCDVNNNNTNDESTPAASTTTSEVITSTSETQKSTYTYSTFTTVSPSNWNELTYQDNNDTQIMGYIGGAFFNYNFKFDKDGEIIDGEFVTEYSACSKLEDVTSTYAGLYDYAIPAGETKNYAYKLTLRKDLKWDDGTAIKADDFVYTMKEQLAPEFGNYRADSYYNSSLIIHNAREYFYQGQSTTCDNADTELIGSVADLTKNSDDVYELVVGDNAYEVRFMIDAPSSWCGGYTLLDFADDLNADSIDALEAMMDDNGYVPVTDETIALVGNAINTTAWAEEPENWISYLEYDFEYEALSFDKVGLFAPSDYELVIILDKPLQLFDDDGSLYYECAYSFGSLPLVKRDLYEKCKKEPTSGSNLWTTNYNSSVETTASWGPYKLTKFQAGKYYELERNPYWYGYNMDENKGLYQTDRITCETIEEFDTRLLKFLAGEIDEIGIDVSVADKYKNSSRALYTADDYVASLQLQSSAEALKARETEGVNKTIITNVKFRKAISLSINRAEYCQTCTTSSKAGFGLFNSMHYYDVAHGGVYRNTDYAKQVLCDTYAVDATKYATLDKAVSTITGFDLTTAKQLVTEAYNEELAAGTISATDKVVFDIGTSVKNEASARVYNFLTKALVEMVKGTPLEGRLETVESEHQDKWATDFRAGGYDICTGGWSGAAWDPGYFLLAYLDPAYMYSQAWETNKVKMTFTMPGVGEGGADVTDEMTLLEWYACLNGTSGCKYNWSEGAVDAEARLALIAALEGQILGVYYTVPLYNFYSASLSSYKIENGTDEYNTFLGYGGIRYMTFNYDDEAWAEYVKSQPSQQLDYTK